MANTYADVIYDDFALAFNYSPLNWFTPDTAPRDFASVPFLDTLVDGTYHATGTVNASCTVSFSGESIRLYGVVGTAGGNYQIDLSQSGGALPSTVIKSSYAAVNTSNAVLFEQTGLNASQSYAVTITNLGDQGNSSIGTQLMLDYGVVSARIGGPGAVARNTTIEDNDPLVVYAGTWNSNNDTRFSGNTSTFTNQAGATASLSFVGSALYIFGDTVNDHGIFTVTLDGNSVDYDGRTDVLKIRTLKFFASGLQENQTHSLVITNRGTGSTFFDLDSIVYTTVVTPPAPIVVSSTSIAVSTATPTTTSSSTAVTSTAPAKSSTSKNRTSVKLLGLLFLSTIFVAISS